MDRPCLSMLLVLFSTVLAFVEVAQSEVSGCSHDCADYHHLCPAIHNETILESYNQGVKTGAIELPADLKMPVTVKCSDAFWKMRCPKACGICVACDESGTIGCRLPHPIQVTGATAEEPASGYSGIESALDDMVWSVSADCYKSKSTKTGWAHFSIPMSVVTKVSLSSLEGNQMDHYRVKVCTGGTHCVECGKMPTASDRYWVQSDCPVGTKGDGIEIRTDHNTNYLQFCEVEITGLGIECANATAKGPEKLAVIVSSTSSRPNDVSMPISVAHDGFSHDTNKCYMSRDSNTGWADFKLASKVHVTKVSVAVRLGTYADDYHIRVCTGQYHCVECSRMPQQTNVNPAWGDSKCPEGTSGDTVKIGQDPTADRLQLCEVKVYEIDWTGDATMGPMKLLSILSSKGDPAHSSYMQLTAAYDGILETTSACYVSEKSKRAWAEFKIEMSLVTKVSITAYTDSATDDYHLQVCVGDKECIECNDFPSRNSLQWADSTCPEGTQGDTVRIVQDNDANHLSLCELKITGRKVQPGTQRPAVPYLIPIKSSQSDAHYSGYKDVSGAHDGYVEGQYSCYKSSSTRQGWAKFKLEKTYQVTKVSVAPMTDDDAPLYDVSVCTGDSHCIDCGVMASNKGDYQFTDSVCPEGTRGDTIHIVQGYQTNLKLCEVKVTGLENADSEPEPEGPPYILKIDSATGYAKDSSYGGVEKAYDGFNYGGTKSQCYGSGTTTASWATFNFEMSEVTKVSIVPFNSPASRLKITSSAASTNSDSSHPVADAHDGSWYNHYYCYRSRDSSTYGTSIYAKFLFTWATVTKVELMSSQHYHTDDFKLYVCTDWSDGSSCISCGYFPSVLAFGWATMSCNAQGKTVKIVAKSGYRLDICEIHIYGYDPMKYSSKVCTNGSKCIECGAVWPNNAQNYEWFYTSCPKGTRGNSVTVTPAENQWLKLCEVKVTGYAGRNMSEGKGPASLVHILSSEASTQLRSDVPSWYPITDAFKGMLTTSAFDCYRSNSASLTWANFSTPMSEVTKVQLATTENGLSRHYFVTICTAGTHCIDCGYFNYASKFTWATVYCRQGTRGDMVRVTSREGQKLDICEIKIYGFNATKTAAGRGAARILDIVSATAADYTQKQISHAVDGKVTSSSYCYRSQHDNLGWAAFKIKKSEVSKVTISPETGADADDYHVKVCTGEKECVECGKMRTVTNLYWTDSVCPPGTVGDTVKINQHPNVNKLKLCEVKISGWDFNETEIVSPGPAKLLEIKNAKGDKSIERAYGVSATYDGILDSRTQCYQSRSDTEGWIHYTIEMSEVTKVSLSARTGSYMDDYYVQVCKKKDDCVDCGYLPSVSNLAWADSICPKGTIGDTIKLSQNPNAQHLEICEIKITGYKGVTSPRGGQSPHTLLEIEDAEASDYKYGHEDIDVAYDGKINEKDECYKSDDDNYGFANFHLQKSVISKVALSSFTGSNTSKYRIKVCEGNVKCVFCSNMLTASNFQWAESTCPEGTQGDTIKVTQDYGASGLEICEIKAIGTPLTV